MHLPTTGRVVVTVALMLAAGLTAGVVGIAAASGAGGSRPIRVDLAYSCRFPSASYPVTAVVTATFPASVVAGTPIDPADVQVAITVPEKAVAYLRGLGGASVSAVGSLAVTATSGGTPVPAAWQLQAPAGAALPATGALTIHSAATAPPAAASAPGTVTYATTGLTLLLTPKLAGGASTNPANVSASCQPAAGSGTRLAAVSVTPGSSSPGASASSSPSDQPKPSKAPSAKNRFPQGCGKIKVHGSGEAVCGYLAGYADVTKLYGAAAPGPVLVNVDFAYKHVFRHNKLIEYSQARVYNKNDKGRPTFPPVRNTFLGFGFVPVTATLSLTERGPINIVSASGISAPPYPISVTATAKVFIAVSDVTVNGVPLAVGAGCHAAHAAKLTLVGHGTNTIPPHGYTVPTGGALSGFLTIPPFVHCGVTQNLDPLLTGSISGPGNFTKMTQGKLCGPENPQAWTCPPPIPKRER